MKDRREKALIELGRLADQIINQVLTDSQLDIKLRGHQETIRQEAGRYLAHALVWTETDQ